MYAYVHISMIIYVYIYIYIHMKNMYVILKVYGLLDLGANFSSGSGLKQ